jgi:uncharacterized membrane protein
MAKFGEVLTFSYLALAGLIYPRILKTPPELVIVLNGYRVELKACANA